MKSIEILLFTVILLVSGCASHKGELKPDILAGNIDTSILPSEDFFSYANGGWMKHNDIPADETGWGIFTLVQNEIYDRLEKVNENAVSSNADESQKKIANFWQAAMDTVKIEKQGFSELKQYLSMIDRVNDAKSLIKVCSDLQWIGVSTLFTDHISQDDKNSKSIAYFLMQGGLGLPDRDYYFNTDIRSVNVRKEYIKHIDKMLKLINIDTNHAKVQANAVFELEKELATSSRKLEALRDPYANYNKYALKDLNRLSPNIDWKLWFDRSGIVGVDSVIIGQPEFFEGLDKLIHNKPIELWQSYLKWHLLNTFSPYLSKALEEEDFNFYGKILMGAEKMRPRWKRVLDAEEDGMGELLGQAYVKNYFNEKAKERYSNMVELIKTALKDRINRLSWMSDSTKNKALQKLEAMKKKVGYPDKWKDFSNLKITDEAYVLNIINCNRWWRNYSLNKLGKPVNREEWHMTPQTYNAYYDPSNNEIVLPAAIFTVPGFLDEDLDDALVFGYVGASTIGHEITHGFDDMGRQYDLNGNLNEWWTKEDKKQFTLRAAAMIKQYNEFIPIDTMHINGSATLGENIADLGGVLLGWDAFIKTEQYKSAKNIAGLSPSKRFFLGYSLGWLWKVRNEALANQLLTDVHSPAKYRVNGPFVNVDNFYEVFQIKPTDKMFRADSLRVKIW